MSCLYMPGSSKLPLHSSCKLRAMQADGSDNNTADDWEYYLGDGAARRVAAVSQLVLSGLIETLPEIGPIRPIYRENYGVSFSDKGPEAQYRPDMLPGTSFCSDCLTRWLFEHKFLPTLSTRCRGSSVARHRVCDIEGPPT